ncbi:MAG: DUF2460 domain-containing protein [Parasphingorhabdus sp.]|nr:DUF2460 domain-containing protein [Parasphingorhabdus sp.]
MGWWLAQERKGQESDFIQRFDPRFWTVNFPRPMMAAVTTTAPDALRVDATFYNGDDLAGLIWDSEDTLDHPLLRYETIRNYSRLTLKFRWRSTGIMPLDAINGPTLTIEGRDAAGETRSWYIRLWNYASGTPTDAQITLPFGKLDGGFLLPEEADPVHPADIDRMFISIIPLEYSATPIRLSNPVTGRVEISEIWVDGQDATLAIGDIMVPEHDLSMATAYDDSFNQTPARLIRQILALGYRGAINHYVGMSHYFRLETQAEQLLVSLSPPLPLEESAALNQPCLAWHRNYAANAKMLGFDLIWSLSYELFDAHCWQDWKQRAENGDPALTGWQPPSTLLSPASAAAMDYLKAVGRAFLAIARDAGMSAKFQIGEPWWWVTPDRRICLYDSSATTALGPLSVSIPSVDAPMSAAQTTMLDACGALLAQSTAALFQAVAAEVAPLQLEKLLLAYLPTILDAAAPELKRANMPLGWAKPAFDILQLEDYDWVIADNRAANAAGIGLATSRLGYPSEEQHYFAGFVLRPEENTIWKHIDSAVRDARARSTPAIFIWALPQVNRNGFVTFSEEEETLEAFDDVQFPIEIGLGATIATSFSTEIVTTLSGSEKRNSNWADARLEFDAGPGLRSEADVRELITFFRARRGAAKAFRFRDPSDFSSNAMVETPTPIDQLLATGDGVKTQFQLRKSYGDPIQSRTITLPNLTSVRVAVNGAETSDWTLGSEGVISFLSPPPDGADIRAGFEFDVPVRFGEDRLEISCATFFAGDIPSIPLIEVKLRR